MFAGSRPSDPFQMTLEEIRVSDSSTGNLGPSNEIYARQFPVGGLLMGLRFATIATSLAVAHGFSSTVAARSSNRVCLSPEYVSRTSPLVAQGGFGPFNDQYGVFRRRPELGRSFSRARESWGNSWNSWSSRSFGFRGNEDPETAIPVAIAKAAALSVAVVAGAYAAPAIWAVVNSGETDSEAVTAFFGAGAAAAGFAAVTCSLVSPNRSRHFGL